MFAMIVWSINGNEAVIRVLELVPRYSGYSIGVYQQKSQAPVANAIWKAWQVSILSVKINYDGFL